MPANTALPTNYLKEFPHSGLIRIRRAQTSATILVANTTFFTYRKKSAVIEGLRFASAFFGKGQFQGHPLVKTEDGYLLTQNLRAPYYQPFPEAGRPADGDWHKMDRALRPQSEIQELFSSVLIKEDNGLFSILIDIQGTDHIPVAVELGFRLGGKFQGVTSLKNIPAAFLLEEGWGEYHFQNQVIRFGPGIARHSWTQLRGAEPKLNAESVYITGFTPFRHQLQIG